MRRRFLAALAILSLLCCCALCWLWWLTWDRPATAAVFTPGGSVGSVYAGGGRVRVAWESGTMKPTGEWRAGWFIVAAPVSALVPRGFPIAALVAGSLVAPAWWWVRRKRRAGARGFEVEAAVRKQRLTG